MMARMTRKPKHVELSEKLKNRFAKLKPHSQIPSARQLSTSYGVSTMTIRQALASLQSDGLIYTIPGSGTFVSGEKLSKRLVFVSFSEEVREKGMKPTSKIMKAERVTVTDKKLAETLQIPVGEFAYRIKRVRLADGMPLAIEDSFVPFDSAPGLLDQDLKNSLYEIFRDVYEKPAVRADAIVSPVLLDKDQAAVLKAPVNTPSLMFTITAFDMRGRVMEHCVSIKRGDKYDFRFSFQA